MSLNIIPDTVQGVGPQFTVFPNEVLLEIFKYIVILPPDSKMGNVVDKKYFGFHIAMGPYSRLRRVCKLFFNLANVAFYNVNDFTFKLIEADNTFTASSNRIPAAIPPVCDRISLRRIHIDIRLEDYYTTPNPDGYNASTAAYTNTYHRITTVNNLFKYCLGARQLRDLTSSTIGFSGLEVLDLHIYTAFHFDDDVQAALAVYRAAAFSVEAGEVKVTVKGVSHDWHPAMVAAIGLQ